MTYIKIARYSFVDLAQLAKLMYFLWHPFFNNHFNVTSRAFVSKSTFGNIEIRVLKISMLMLKSHTSEEATAHLRISCLHFLMNIEKPEKSELWKKRKKIAGDIILHVCTKNHTRWYCSWDRQWVNWVIFCPFTLLATPKIKFLKERKQNLHHFTHMCTINGNHLIYGSWDMECDWQNCLILDHFLRSLTP